MMGIEGIKLISCKHVVILHNAFIMVKFVNHIGMEGHSEGPVDSQESVHAQHEQENFTRQIAEELRRLA